MGEDSYLDSYMEDQLSGGYDVYNDYDRDEDEGDYEDDEDYDHEPSDDFPEMLERDDWRYGQEGDQEVYYG